MSIEKAVIGNATQKWTAIYALCERDSMAPRYVGKTVQYIIDRFKAHKREANRGGKRPVSCWLRKRVPHGGAALLLLEHVPPMGDWAARERHWIELFRQQGHNLLNLTLGGEGLAGHVFTQEHREKIAASNRTGAWFGCMRCGAQFWRKRYAILKGQNKFCGRSCSNKHNQGGWHVAS